MSDLFTDRTPPQNIEAEQAVLGAVFLEPEALTTASELLVPEDFYRAAHQRIFMIMLELAEKSEPIDLVTVTAELQDRKLLEEVGGVSYLSDLANSVPTAANIEYYSNIVEEKSLLRRLIRVATEIAANGYAREDEVEEILNEAEKQILEVAQRKNTGAFISIKDVLVETYDNIEMLQNFKGDITGIATGFAELDRMTAGFQRNDLIIVAARPSVGKTAFALNIAQNVAVKTEENVAVFSLEMGAQQLVMRMLCAEGNIDAQRLRTGRLESEDWQKLTMAMGSLSNAGIYIDDTPGIRVNEIRAKCRRLKQEKGLGMILIDYLQLIAGSGKPGENRQQEVSEISRALKGLARELEVPVIALSQLSRGVESRQDKRPMMSDIRESGCLSYDTLITRADTGERVEIGSLVGQENIPVLSMNEDMKLETSMISKVFSSGYKQLFELQTASGRTIKASSNHPFYTIDRWKAVEELNVGERAAVARKVDVSNVNNDEPMNKEELGLLAHLIGDGCVLARQPFHYTSIDNENIEYVSEAAFKLFGIKSKIVEQQNWKHVYLTSPYRLARGKRHPITLWFEDMGIWNLRSYEKKVPDRVFQQTHESIGWFLHHLWATDGCIHYREGKQGRVYYSTSSKILAEQVQHLLLRLGIISRLRTVKQGRYRDNYHVTINGKDMQSLFFAKVGCFGARGKIISEFASTLIGTKGNPNRDIIPKEIWTYVSSVKDNYGLSWRKVSAGIETAYCGSTLFKSGLSRQRMLRLSEVIPDQKLSRLSVSDVYWDEIVSITPLEIEEVFDATVPGNHNFVANDFIVHNSIEQDADIVAFLYRDDYYDQESENKNIIEIIIAKQRNGPVGTVELAFVKEYNKFVNLERRHDEASMPPGG
jgi:replicative DNA helicase